jgi:hypothetical protein
VSRPTQSTTGWAGSCLTFTAQEYAKFAESPTWPGTPVSADAEAHFRVAQYSNYIAGRMLKIDRVHDESMEAAK